MSGTWLIGAALALFVLVGGGLLRTEATTRLERFPLLILRLAARRLPHVLRAEQLEEWRANVLDVIEPSSVGLPLTRIARGCSFALSSWWGARRLARTQIPTTPRDTFVALLVSRRYGGARFLGRDLTRNLSWVAGPGLIPGR